MTNDNSVTLTWDEAIEGAQIGVRRHRDATGYHPAYGAPAQDAEEAIEINIEGACGEMAFAKYGGFRWQASVNTFKSGADVGSLHVRTRSKHWHDLIVRKDDPDEGVFVLVTGVCPTYRVVGYTLAADCRRKEWWHAYGHRPPAYFVPQSVLTPFSF